jgi:hypothetical protein
MPSQSPQPELSHICDHPGCCDHGALGTETLASRPTGGLADREEPQKAGRWDSLKRSVLWFLAFSGIYASSSVCPFCGTPGCPVGVGGAALVGGVFACLWQYGRGAWEKLTGFFTKGSR